VRVKKDKGREGRLGDRSLRPQSFWCREVGVRCLTAQLLGSPQGEVGVEHGD
jgi:hypothetical protein